MTGRASGVKMSPGFAVARASRTSFSNARWFLSICSGVASFGSFGSDLLELAVQVHVFLQTVIHGRERLRLLGCSGPTTRSVAGASPGTRTLPAACGNGVVALTGGHRQDDRDRHTDHAAPGCQHRVSPS